MSNTSSTKKAQRIAEGFARLSGQGLVGLQKALGQTAVTQASLGIRRGQTPYGEPFKPLVSRVGRPLRRTGNTIQRRWTAGRYTRDSFGFGNAFKYIMVHQRGAVIRPKRFPFLYFRTEKWGRVRAKKVTIPARQMVPEDRTGGLGRWQKPFERQIGAYIHRAFGGES